MATLTQQSNVCFTNIDDNKHRITREHLFETFQNETCHLCRAEGEGLLWKPN